ncbi:ABC transporter permease [Pseudovibrio exalbescens]|uniref:Sugar ABC transporter permease n=1 Tax=Pseudovibrio exalbescens TaxID=197461 RepID=A0A1U7JHQ1_9HYPH|nr:ABC transporter permease [Pseudovibrio exalbescens]OKL44212.1 sugar ABC transporter permease [Pseudovibrio exalbescens]
MFDVIILVLDSTLRLSTPLLFACLAGLFSERSGVVDIGLEGKMLGGAFAAGTVAYLTGNPWAGLLAAICISIVLSLIHGFASITNRGNQIVSGVAINFLAAGLSVLLGQAWFGQGGRTPQLEIEARFAPITLPFADSVRDVPFLGPIYADLISGHNILVYAAFLTVPLTWWIVFRTRFGLRLRAVGESPHAVDTAGISVVWLRYRAVIICGALCGFAGAYLAIAQSAGFIKDMSAGKGFIALAALIFAKWRPVSAMFACLLFGFLDAIANLMQGQEVPGIGEVPVQFFQALPYILTVVLLAGFIGRAIPPKNVGVPYVKERT